VQPEFDAGLQQNSAGEMTGFLTFKCCAQSPYLIPLSRGCVKRVDKVYRVYYVYIIISHGLSGGYKLYKPYKPYKLS
jgi:hypothetical protein